MVSINMIKNKRKEFDWVVFRNNIPGNQVHKCEARFFNNHAIP
jgi:hypothetical protein